MTTLAASPSGRPALFSVMRDASRECGDEYGVVCADRASQLWHRASEEWELVRFHIVEDGGTFVALYTDGDPEEIRDYYAMYGITWPHDGWNHRPCDCAHCVSRRVSP